VDSFLHQFLDILKVAFHLHFKILLHVADVDLVHQLVTGNLVDDDRHSAMTYVLTLAWSSASSAVAVPYFKIN
jgi:hypothetical protein